METDGETFKNAHTLACLPRHSCYGLGQTVWLDSNCSFPLVSIVLILHAFTLDLYCFISTSLPMTDHLCGLIEVLRRGRPHWLSFDHDRVWAALALPWGKGQASPLQGPNNSSRSRALVASKSFFLMLVPGYMGFYDLQRFPHFRRSCDPTSWVCFH